MAVNGPVIQTYPGVHTLTFTLTLASAAKLSTVVNLMFVCCIHTEAADLLNVEKGYIEKLFNQKL